MGVYDVRGFGLVDNNLYLALVKANTRVVADGGGVIWIPPGTYVLPSNFSPSANVALWIAERVTISGAGSISAGSGHVVDFRGGLTVDASPVAPAPITATSTLYARFFVGSDLQQAAIDSLTVVGVAPVDIATAAVGMLASSGTQLVMADAPLALGDNVKVGIEGRATKWNSGQVTIQTAITGEATAFTQPVAATAVEVVQAADVVADRGRGIVIEGSNGVGAAITETITLNATNTTTAHAGAVSFTKISAVYMADGAVLGAQAVTVRASGAGATVCTLGAGTSELAADIPAQSREAYCQELTITGPNTDATFVTIVGIDSYNVPNRERCHLNAASPSTITSTTIWRYINRICLGEFTNAAVGAVKTNSVVDTAGMKCGVVLGAAAARGDNATVLIKPNA